MLDKDNAKINPTRRKAEPLTEAKVAKAMPRERRWILADATVRGLVVRIEPSGSKSFYVRSRIGKGRGAPWAEIRLGEVGQVRLAEARDEARRLLVEMRSGKDPRAPQREETPVRDVIRRYEARLVQRGVVRRSAVIRSLEVNLGKHLYRRLGDLTRADVVGEIERIEASGRSGAAEDFRRHCVAMLNWSVSAGMLAASPMAGYRRERETRSQKISRPKVVLHSRDTLSRAWRAFGREEDPWFAALLKFLLLTGQRRTETALATWSDIDLDEQDPVWSIPADVRKMGDAHRVPLGSFSRSLLTGLPRHACNLVFPGRRGAPMSGWTQRLSNIRMALGEPAFAFHALRRTYRTGLSELGVPFEIAELMIGHARPDLARRYDYASLWRQRRDAQNLWEQHVEEVVHRET